MITRRAFLGGAALGASALACGGPRRAPAPVEADRLVIHGWLGAFPALLEQRLRDGLLAGVTIVRQNAASLDELARTIERIRTLAARPILVCCTQEGGSSRPLAPELTHWPAALRFADASAAGAATDAEALAEACGRAQGDELRAIGFDVNFAPVLDVHTNPANPIIGDRAFGTEPEAVARRALAFARGLDEAGLLACGKHFPGHGDTLTDSHLELPRIDHGWERLERVELLPFQRAAEAGLPMIMTAHVVFGAIDPDRPATLSAAVVTGLLRERLGYRGVIVSDDLGMNAIAAHMGVGVAAVAAVRAGCDVLLVCHHEDQQEVAEAALIREAEGDSELRRKIGEAAARVRAMKRAHAENQRRRPAPPRDIIGCAEHVALAGRLAGR
jgi:beta-N-acetylhexosaminidase